MDKIKRKDYKYKYFPPTTEWHGFGTNWMGPGTDIYNRIGLTYKGNVGSEAYFLPISKDDLTSFKHDLLYYSPDNVVKAFADKKFLGDVLYKSSLDANKILALLGISGRYIQRVSPSALGFVGSLVLFPESAKGKVRDLLKLFKRYGPSGFLFNRETGLMPEPYKRNMNDFMRQYFGMTLQPSPGRAVENHKNFVITKLIPAMTLYGLGYFGNPIKSIVKSFESVIDTFMNSDEYNDIRDNFNNVYEKYADYLKTVGYFEGNKFKVKDDIDKDEAKEKYLKFYDQFENYIEFINDYYKTYPDFKPYDIPSLNIENLNIVGDPPSNEVYTPKKDIIEIVEDMIDKNAIKLTIDDIKYDLNEVTSGLPADEKTGEKIIYGLPEVTSSLPKVTYDLPKVSSGLPKVTYDLPKVTSGLPKVTYGLPTIPADIKTGEKIIYDLPN